MHRCVQGRWVLATEPGSTRWALRFLLLLFAVVLPPCIPLLSQTISTSSPLSIIPSNKFLPPKVTCFGLCCTSCWSHICVLSICSSSWYPHIGRCLWCSCGWVICYALPASLHLCCNFSLTLQRVQEGAIDAGSHPVMRTSKPSLGIITKKFLPRINEWLIMMNRYSLPLSRGVW